MKFTPPLFSRHGLLATAFLVAGSASALAIDWTQTTGPFGTAANWSGGAVPAGVAATIGNGGTATVAAGNSFNVATLAVGGHSGTGAITQSGGALSASQVMIGGDDSFGGSGQGSYALTGGTLTGGNNEMWVGSRGGTGTLAMSGTAAVVNGIQIIIGRDAGGTGTLDLAGSARLSNLSNHLYVGINAPGKSSTATVRENATLASADEIYIGWLGGNTCQGTLVLKDHATLTAVNGVVIGRDSGKGTMTVGDSAVLEIGGGLMAGAGSNAVGAITVNDSARITTAWLGIPLNNDASGTFTLNGGLVKTTAVSGDHQGAGFWAAGSGTARTLNLNGGVLEVNRFLKGGGNQALGIHFNGGTIRAAGNAAQFFTAGSGSMGGSAGFTSADFEVQAGGLFFDTNGYEVGIAPGLGGAGGLTKSGGGALYLNGPNTYAGPTVVSAGTLGGTGSVTGAVSIAAGATLSPGVSTGTFTAGSVALAGTYRCDIDDALSDQLVVTGALDLTGATLDLRQAAPASRPVILLARYGSLTGQFASVTGLPSGYLLDYAYQGQHQIALVLPGGSRFGAWVTGYFPGVTDPQITGPDADPDHDGQPNALEFAFGGLPNQGGSSGAVQVIPGESGVAPTFTVAVPQGTPAFTGSPSPSATTQGYILTVGGSDDLLSDNVPVTPVPPLATGLPAAPSGYEYRSFRLAQPLPAPGKGFLRVSATPYTGEDLAVGDFDGPTFGDWISTGTAFSLGPATGSELTQLEITHADGGVASSEKQDDAPTGTLTSPVFRISRRYLAYRIGGGDYEHDACLNLLIDGQVVKSATGRTSDNLIEASWDLQKFAGKDAQIQIVDRAQGNWGHVNVGRMFQTDSPPVLPLQKGVLYHESLRPQLHFTAKQEIMDRLNPGERQEGWLNDLNGMIYYGGEYHLFAQRWNKCWIHAVSTDLLHWQELPPAFWEDPLDSGVQSGTCVVDYQNTSGLSPDPATPPLVAFWTGNDNHSHCICYSLDHGRTWTRYANNPVLDFPERDPKVFWHAPSSKWVMVMYGGGQYHFLTSPDLLHWTNTGNAVDNAYECPDFFEIPLTGNPAVKKWALIHGDGYYSLGSFDGSRFTAETDVLPSDVGGFNFYATQTFNNVETGDGRRIQLAWMRGSDFPGMPFSQQVSFPCEMTLHQTPAGLRLFRQPVGELANLYDGGGQSWSDLTLTGGQEMPLAATGEFYRIQAQVSIPAGAKLTFSLRGYAVTVTSTSLDGGSGAASVQGQIGSVDLLLDRASVESFANGGEVSCTRYFLPGQDGISMKASGGNVTVQSLSIHALKSIWAGQ